MERSMSRDYQRYCSLNSEIAECYHAACIRLGLSDSVMQILYVLCLEEEPCPIGLILAESGLSKQTVHSALRSLEAGGYMRLAALDGRRKGAVLTEAGKALREQAAGVPGEVGCCVHLTPEEAGQLYALLYKALDGLR